MYSDERNRCSHRLGFPIRKSPDHRLLASTRGLSQLTTSFIACLRQGIHTRALSSLTIKSTSDTNHLRCHSCAWPPHNSYTNLSSGSCITCDLQNNARQIFSCQRSDFFTTTLKTSKIVLPLFSEKPPSNFFLREHSRETWWAWVDSNYRPHPYQGCALAT